MQCERLVKMIKSWYLHVREETMAPARMVGFMEKHIDTCDICLQDPDVRGEVAKITELVLPESKIPKAVRQQKIQEETLAAEDDSEELKDSADGDEDETEGAETEEDEIIDDDEEDFV